jgi:hypothetical protein
MTGEKDSRLTLDINSDLLWRSLSYWDLHKIPKIFLFDAAKFPSSYTATKKGIFFRKGVRSFKMDFFKNRF